MPSPNALSALTDKLHISHSQIFTYLNCSLKYRFRYVLGLSPERLGLALPFGSAIHKALEYYYRGIIDGKKVSLNRLQKVFSSHLTRELSEKGNMVVYTKGTPDKDSALQLGVSMLDAFYRNIDLKGGRVVAIELPLSATLYTTEGVSAGIDLIGIIDLLMEDKSGSLIVVDHKTAARAKTQSDVNADLQMTVYSYLLASNRYVFPTASVQCRFDVLRKLKTPKLEHYHTRRCAEDRKRLAWIASGVLGGIEAGVFIPLRSWMCVDCEYAQACSDWHKS